MLLGLDGEHLLVLGVVETDLVEAAAALGAVGADALHRIGGLGAEGRQIVFIVDRARDQRPVGIAVQELDHHLVADARDHEGAIILAGAHLRHAHPQAARMDLAAAIIGLNVPEELHFDAAIFVGVDFLALRAHDLGRLGAGDARHRCLQRRAEWVTHRHQLHFDPHVLIAAAGRTIARGVILMAGADDQIFLRAVETVAAAAFVEGDLELAPHGHRKGITFAMAARHVGAVGLQADIGIAGPALQRGLVVIARIFKTLGNGARHIGGLAAAPAIGARAEIGQLLLLLQHRRRLGIVIIIDGVGGRAEAAMLPQRPQHGFLPVGRTRQQADRVGCAGAVRGRRVHRHQLVAARRVLEEIIDALALHVARDKIEIAFVVLYAIFDRRIAGRERLPLLRQQLDQIGDRLLVVNLGTAVERQQILLGAHHDAVEEIIAFAAAAQLHIFAQDAVKAARDMILPGELETHRFFQILMQVNRPAARDHFGLDHVQFGQSLNGGHPHQQELSIRRRADLADAIAV